jgi:enterochelin esterase-like enzyme
MVLDGRRLTVYVPPKARVRKTAATGRHPLLVLHDGQNLFEPERAFVPNQHWRVGETADALIAAHAIPPLVICGIDHGGANRLHELSPTPGSSGEGGGASAHGRFIVDRVLPRLRAEFEIAVDRHATGLGGSSLGALATLAVAIEHPNVFGRLLVMSPSIWWDGRVILDRVARAPQAFANTRIWVDAGRREGQRTVADARQLADVIAHLPTKSRPGPIVRFVEDARGDHSERSWAKRLPGALAFLFGTDARTSRRESRSM